MDLFDPKPALAKFHGKPYPGQLEIHFNNQAGNVLASPFRFTPAGSVGNGAQRALAPHRRRSSTTLTLIRSMTTESVDHEAALRLIHTGKILAGRPTWGSWVIYALGSENHNLPAVRRPLRPRRPARGRRAELVQRLAAGDLPGHAVPLGRNAGPQPRDAPGSDARGPRGPAPVPRRAEPRPPGPPSRQLRARGADHQLRDRRPDADGRPRGRQPGQRARVRSGGCTAWTTRPPASTARAA